MSAGRVAGKVAFITGAARGQGRSHAVRLAEEGADIIAVDVCRPVRTVPYPAATAADLAETVRQVEAVGRRIVAAEVDVRELAALSTAVDEGVARLGRLDIVVANAGVFTTSPALELDEETWQAAIDVNLTGVWKTVRAAVPHVVAGGRGGAVVLIGSLAALQPSVNTAHYAAAKAGLVGFMQVLARELAPHNIRVNTVHPATVATDMILNDHIYRLFRPDLEHPTRADFEPVAARQHRLPTPALEPADISAAVLYLVSDDGRFVTGNTHVVDAGARL